MNGFYEDNILARLIAEERTFHREYVQLAIFRNPISVVKELVNQVVGFVKEKLQEPTLIPVYCFEYAPDC